MEMGYVLAATIVLVVVFPLAWPLWWMLASLAEHSGQQGARRGPTAVT